MPKNENTLIDQLISSPQKLFLLDGVGAFISAIFLGIVLVWLNDFIGMPVQVLYVLATLAAFYMIFSLSCYYFEPNAWRICLRIIATANFLHCILTIGLLYQYRAQIQPLGWLYFVGELLILFFIVNLEWKGAKK